MGTFKQYSKFRYVKKDLNIHIIEKFLFSSDVCMGLETLADEITAWRGANVMKAGVTSPSCIGEHCFVFFVCRTIVLTLK